jgi:hypothetical protein
MTPRKAARVALSGGLALSGLASAVGWLAAGAEVQFWTSLFLAAVGFFFWMEEVL